MYVGLFEASKRSAGIIFSIILGYAFFKEEIKSSKIISCGVIAFGVWFLFLT
jgi:multidrug transporter EmrE-like cation transporter